MQREQNNQVGFHYLSGELFLSWADFLLGQSGAQNGSGISNMFGSIDLLGLFDRAYRDWEVWSYAQDDFKALKTRPCEGTDSREFPVILERAEHLSSPLRHRHGI